MKSQKLRKPRVGTLFKKHLPFITAALLVMGFLFLMIVVFPGATAGITANLPRPFSDFILPVLWQPEIKDFELASHVRFLASDRLAGRKSGSPGIILAEEYISTVFERAGLAVMPGSDSYLQGFDLYRSGFDPKRTAITVSIDNDAFPLLMNVNTAPFYLSGDGEARAGMVFAGYGITAPEAARDDYRDIDAKGRIAIILRGEPDTPGTIFAQAGFTKHAQFNTKLRNARLHGALAVIFVMFKVAGMPEETEFLQPAFHYSLTPVPPAGSEAEKSEPVPEPDALPCFIIANLAASSLFDRLGYSLPVLMNSMDTGLSPAKIDISTLKASLSVHRMQEPEKIACRNVTGFLPGTDPGLADEWILVTAHHDHIGTSPDNIYNGADDNASGVSGVLELAEAFAALPPALRKRSMLFMTFSAEEEGLFGSEAFLKARADIIPKIRIVSNMDMIGRNRDYDFGIITRKPGTQLSVIIDEATAQTGMIVSRREVKNDYYSDDYTFADKGIETMFFFSGLHPDYHGPDDEADRLDYAEMEKRVKFIFEILKKTAVRS